MTVPADLLGDVARAASDDAGRVPVELLGDFLPALVTAVSAGERIPAARLRAYRTLGDRAARQGVALRALLDLYLSAAWRLWRHLPPVAAAQRSPDGVVVAGEVVLHAVDDAVAVLTEGYQLARRSLVRAEESVRREFVDDLLSGTADLAGIVHRAATFGLDLAAPHAVVTVAAERPFDDASPLVTAVERAVLGRKGDAGALVATSHGQLAVVFAAPDRAAVDHVVDRIAATLRRAPGGRVGRWRMGLGRSRAGAIGVAGSFRESVEAVELADRLGLAAPVADAGALLAYQVLLRDRVALADLVESTLAPLRTARGGAEPLVRTLIAWFDANGNTAAAARALHLSVRAVTYRLERIRALTGLDPADAEQRLPLQLAVLGSRLLDASTAGSEDDG